MTDAGTIISLIAVAVAAGTEGGILAGLLGVGGGIVIVPALYLALSATKLAVGVEMQVAVATSLATIVLTALSSSRAHNRRGAVDHALLRRWSPWIIVGVVVGGPPLPQMEQMVRWRAAMLAPQPRWLAHSLAPR